MSRDNWVTFARKVDVAFAVYGPGDKGSEDPHVIRAHVLGVMAGEAKDVIAENLTDSPFYMAVLDHEHKQVLVSVRGTANTADMLLDSNAFPALFQCPPPPDRVPIRGTEGGECCHEGMLSAAYRINHELKETLANATREYGYPVHVTGHSLGAGTASLLALLLQRQGMSGVSMTGFGCPACCSMPLCQELERLEGGSKNYVYRSDIVPRLSVHSLKVSGERLKACADEICPSSSSYFAQGAAMVAALASIGTADFKRRVTTKAISERIAAPYDLFVPGSLELLHAEEGATDYDVTVRGISPFDLAEPVLAMCMTPDHSDYVSVAHRIREAVETDNAVDADPVRGFVHGLARGEEARVAEGADTWRWCAEGEYSWDIGHTQEGPVVHRYREEWQKAGAWTGYNYRTFTHTAAPGMVIVGVKVQSVIQDGWGGGSWRVPSALVMQSRGEVEVASALCKGAHWVVEWYETEAQ
ncbi:hypothetical protein KIPB_002295 [Kipferlia bialata]|uniref:sn-1-specific diacylglycerol lipase n=1 Tax=Kipferlia bialata TaxID=797122 RepID=A0A9K3CPZ2_9EUKA|nr:hypothetical protein KIPB_002295 [Kipferlia bialata]|eukprot:g2295.t1